MSNTHKRNNSISQLGLHNEQPTYNSPPNYDSESLRSRSASTSMSSAIHPISPPGIAAQQHKPTLFQRFANALVYVLAFPFIAIFIGMKNVFTKQKGPAHSYYERLPEQHYLGGSSSGVINPGAAEGGSGNVAGRTRSRKA